MEIKSLSHVDEKNTPTMVDVSLKRETLRTAQARATIWMPSVVANCFNGNEINSKKGPVIATSIIAGTQAAKQTSNLIPFCHPLMLESVKLSSQFKILPDGSGVLEIVCQAKVSGKTGVEMEALTGVSVAALTFYDMCKALSHDIRIQDISLLEKTGGKSGDIYVEK